MGSFGAVIHGPSGHFVYGFLERTFPGPSKPAIIKKVGMSRIITLEKDYCSFIRIVHT